MCRHEKKTFVLFDLTNNTYRRIQCRFVFAKSQSDHPRLSHTVRVCIETRHWNRRQFVFLT